VNEFISAQLAGNFFVLDSCLLERGGHKL